MRITLYLFSFDNLIKLNSCAVMDNQYTGKLWEIIQKGITSPIPSHLKNQLKMQGLDNIACLSMLEDSVITESEEFIKSDEYFNSIPRGENLINFYGLLYQNNRINFKYTLGDKCILKSIKNFVVKQSAKFWSKNLNLESHLSEALELDQPGNSLTNESAEEKNKIICLLKKNMIRNLDNNSIENLTINISNKNNEQIAKVVCNSCDTEIQVQKTNKSTWNVYNFKRHYLENHNNNDEQPARKRKRNSKNQNK